MRLKHLRHLRRLRRGHETADRRRPPAGARCAGPHAEHAAAAGGNFRGGGRPFGRSHAAGATRPCWYCWTCTCPAWQGAAGVSALRLRFPAVRLRVVSGDDDPATMRAVLAAGAVGFLPRAETGAVMQQALRLVRDGGCYVPCRAGPWFVCTRHRTARRGRHAHAAPARVLRCLMQGQPNKQIARELGLGEGTLTLHIAAVLRALRARNRTEAAVRAREIGLGPRRPGSAPPQQLVQLVHPPAHVGRLAIRAHAGPGQPALHPHGGHADAARGLLVRQRVFHQHTA